MARPKEFERDEALEQALEVFWDKGFDSTSMQDLVDAMGIGRASLYDTFGNKQALFREAMELYRRHMMDDHLACLRQPGPVREVLRSFLRRLVEAACSPDFKGCLAVKTALAKGQLDDETAEQIEGFTSMVEKEFENLFKRARKQGELRSDLSPRSMARFLVNTMRGLSVTASLNADRKAMDDVVRVTLATLDLG